MGEQVVEDRSPMGLSEAARRWQEENRAAIDAWNHWYDENGAALDRIMGRDGAV